MTKEKTHHVWKPRSSWSDLPKDDLFEQSDRKQSSATSTKDLTLMGLSKEHWTNPIEFFLSVLGYAVGLTNLLRFPYLCMTKGGGSFLIPYFTFMFISAMPMFLGEAIIGQYTGLSAGRVFEFAPFFQGIGLAMMLVSGISVVYYCNVMAWSYFYFFSSFSWELPWTSCYNEWNTDNCRELVPINETTIIEGWSRNTTNSTALKVPVFRGTMKFANWNVSFSAAEEFWYNRVLNLSKPMEMGSINLPMLGCLCLAWALVFLCLVRGVKSIGKVVYVTAIAPYVFLLVILIRALTMPGPLIGLKYYLIPDWQKLADINIWCSAAVQIFYSLGPCWGGVITMASYNKFHHNCYRDSILIPLITCMSSFFGGFAIFSVLGNMAHFVGAENFEKIASSGFGLAFIAYPEALSQIPGAPIFSAIFFLMLIALGLDSQFSTLETFTSGFIERFPQTIGRYRKTFILLVCIGGFLLGIPFVYQGGYHIFIIIDTYSTACTITLIGILESISLAYFYNAKNLIKHMRQMVGNFLSCLTPVWYALWYAVLPGCMCIVFFSIWLTFAPPSSPKGGEYPSWSVIMGWGIACISLAPMPLYMIFNSIKYRKDLKQMFKPSPMFKKLIQIRERELLVSSEVELTNTTEN